MKDRIIELLGRGISATQVASAVGCDDSYISQLMQEPGIADKVIALKTEHFSHYLEQDQKLDHAEELALRKVESLMPFISKPLEAVRVYDILNAAKRRTADSVQTANQATITVALDLPEATRLRFTTTPDRQVIEIEGRSMTTMPARSMASRLEERNAARLLNMQVPTTLPIKSVAQNL